MQGVCVWARHNQLTISGKAPTKTAFGRRPPDRLGADTANPAQLSTQTLIQYQRDLAISVLAQEAHLRARPLSDLLRDVVSQSTTDRGTLPGRRSCIVPA